MEVREERKQRRRAQVRAEILVASRQVLLSRGLGGFTLAAVARELELTKPALYHYFSSKEALIFELILVAVASYTEVAEAAIAGAEGGADAVERMIRTSAEYYAHNLDELRLTYMVPQVASAHYWAPDEASMARLRPYNDRLYGPVAEAIQRDQEAGRVPQELDPRRFAFVAHLAVIGLLVMEGLVATADDPLLHKREMMLDDLVASFRARLALGIGR